MQQKASSEFHTKVFHNALSVSCIDSRNICKAVVFETSLYEERVQKAATIRDNYFAIRH